MYLSNYKRGSAAAANYVGCIEQRRIVPVGSEYKEVKPR